MFSILSPFPLMPFFFLQFSTREIGDGFSGRLSPSVGPFFPVFFLTIFPLGPLEVGARAGFSTKTVPQGCVIRNVFPHGPEDRIGFGWWEPHIDKERGLMAGPFFGGSGVLCYFCGLPLFPPREPSLYQAFSPDCGGFRRSLFHHPVEPFSLAVSLFSGSVFPFFFFPLISPGEDVLSVGVTSHVFPLALSQIFLLRVYRFFSLT